MKLNFKFSFSPLLSLSFPQSPFNYLHISHLIQSTERVLSLINKTKPEELFNFYLKFLVVSSSSSSSVSREQVDREVLMIGLRNCFSSHLHSFTHTLVPLSIIHMQFVIQSWQRVDVEMLKEEGTSGNMENCFKIWYDVDGTYTRNIHMHFSLEQKENYSLTKRHTPKSVTRV